MKKKPRFKTVIRARWSNVTHQYRWYGQIWDVEVHRNKWHDGSWSSYEAAASEAKRMYEVLKASLDSNFYNPGGVDGRYIAGYDGQPAMLAPNGCPCGQHLIHPAQLADRKRELRVRRQRGTTVPGA